MSALVFQAKEPSGTRRACLLIPESEFMSSSLAVEQHNSRGSSAFGLTEPSRTQVTSLTNSIHEAYPHLCVNRLKAQRELRTFVAYDGFIKATEWLARTSSVQRITHTHSVYQETME